MLKDNWLLFNVLLSVLIWILLTWLFGGYTLVIMYISTVTVIGTYGVISDYLNPDIKNMHWWTNYLAVIFLVLIITITPLTYYNKWLNK